MYKRSPPNPLSLLRGNTQNKFLRHNNICTVFLGGSVVKNPLASAGNVGSILGSVRSPGEGNDNPLQYSCLGNPMDRGGMRSVP